MAAQCTAQCTAQCFVQVGRALPREGPSSGPATRASRMWGLVQLVINHPSAPRPPPCRQQPPPGQPGQRGAARWSVRLQRVRPRLVQPIGAPMCGCHSHRRRRCRLLGPSLPPLAPPTCSCALALLPHHPSTAGVVPTRRQALQLATTLAVAPLLAGSASAAKGERWIGGW